MKKNISEEDGLQISWIDGINDFEEVIYFYNQEAAVKGIIAIHNTTQGPALGGCRLRDYSSFQDGLDDVLLLAKAMTYKNSIMGLPFGGGKAVIFKNAQVSREDALKVFALALNKIQGRYITTDDIGTSVSDMDYLRQFTQHARGVFYEGKQIPATAFGVYQAIKATLNYDAKLNSLQGIRVVVQGLGKVGYVLCRYLHQEGCDLYVDDCQTELVSGAIKEFNATSVKINELDNFKADLFSPCALGGTVSEEVFSKLQVKYIIGGANNQLSSAAIGEKLHQRDILFIPDYLCSAGGVIDIACEDGEYNEDNVLASVRGIYDKTLEVLELARSLGRSPIEICDQQVYDQLYGG